MLEGNDIVCFSTADWDMPLPTNQHQLMCRLAEKNKVLFIETIGTRLPTSRKTDLNRLRQRLIRGFQPPRQISSDNLNQQLWVFSPLVLPFHQNSVCRVFNRLWLSRCLKKALERLGFSQPIGWVYSPYAVHYLKDIEAKLTVYHCVDDLSLVPGASASAMRRAEAKLLQQAQLVFATSNKLYQNCRTLNEHCYLLPNVADFRHFHQVMLNDYAVAPEMRRFKQPIIMFSGNIAPHKVDLKLIEFLCGQRFDWTFVLIGPLWEGLAKPVINQLGRWGHLHFLPPVPYPELPHYLKAADVLIIPYLINEVTSTVFPLKFFEYLATGKPVVSTPLPTLKEYKALVPMPDTYPGFLRAIGELLQSDPNQEERLKVAGKNTWEDRIREMSDLIEQRLKQLT